jgi:hypothetical protein
MCKDINVEQEEYTIIIDKINELISKNKEFNIIFKNTKVINKYKYDKDGNITEIKSEKFYEDGRFMEKLFVDYFQTKHNVVYSEGTGFLIFDGTIWENCSDIHIQHLIAEILESEDELTNSKVAASYKMLVNQVNNDKLGELLNSNRNRLVLKNGMNLMQMTSKNCTE